MGQLEGFVFFFLIGACSSFFVIGIWLAVMVLREERLASSNIVAEV